MYLGNFFMQDWKAVIKSISNHMTQKEIAEKTGMTQGAISHLLTGRRKSVQYENGVKLKNLYDEITQSEKVKA